MPRTAGAAEAFGNTGNADAGLVTHAVWVDFRNVGVKQQVAAGCQQFFLVGGEGTRILVQIFTGAELQWIDEDAGDHEVGALGGDLHQRNVTRVQIAHGRHETDLLAFGPCLGDGCAQLAQGFHRVHAEKPCSAAGKLPSLTACT